MFRKFLPVFFISIFMLSAVNFAGAQTVGAGAQSQKEPATEVKTQTSAQSVETKAPSEAQAQPKEEVIKGVIKEIAPDGSYIVIDDTKIITTKEFLEDSYLEVGDNVEVTADKTDQGLKAKNYNYIFEEEGPSVSPEDNTTGTEGNMPQGY